MTTLVLVLDLFGTFAFGLSGALQGFERRLDLFGVLVLAYATATFGGITRDLLIGAVPPPGVSDWRYLATSVGAGLVIFFGYRALKPRQHLMLILDAAGLALFAVSGAQKALAFGLHPVMSAVLGMLTGIGGGVARDVMMARIPTVLREDLYALAALAGAAVVVIGAMVRLPAMPTALAGMALCFFLRVAALRRGWQVPKASPPGHDDRGRD